MRGAVYADPATVVRTLPRPRPEHARAIAADVALCAELLATGKDLDLLAVQAALPLMQVSALRLAAALDRGSVR